MRIARLTTISLLALALTTSYALASSDKSDAGYTDTHPHKHHGSVSSFTEKFFGMMDADNNGEVTLAERNAAPHQEMLLPFEKVDTNGDGVLTLEEYRKVVFGLHSRPKGENA